MTMYALLVGINAYRPPINALYGCRGDIEALQHYLGARAGTNLELETLFDEQATRAAIMEMFRRHLGRAKAGDVALFAFAGHGSEEAAPAELAALESTSKIQSIVPYDTGRSMEGTRIRAIADKEMAVLLAGVAAGGAHTVTILDCCNSGGADRDVFTSVRGWRPDPEAAETDEEREIAVGLQTPRTSAEFDLGELADWHPPIPRHVALAACQSSEKAKEHRVGTQTKGAFSSALIDALDVLGPRTTYRSLLQAVRSRVERTTRDQRPELFPLDAGGPGDGLFLDGAIVAAPVSYTMTSTGAGWQVDAGLVHGLRPPAGSEAFILACTRGGQPAGTVRVTAVAVATATVEPIGWTPDDGAYAAVMVDVPLPRAEIAIDPSADGLDDATDAIAEAISAAIATAGPGGAPSPFVRSVTADAPADAGALRLRVAVPEPGALVMTRADGSPIAGVTRISADPAGLAGDARLLVSRLEHVARWEQVRTLGDHPSPLAGAVSLHAYPGEAGEAALPADRIEIPAAGGFRLTYTTGADGSWQHPWIFLSVRNETAETLYVAVLDLTDRYACTVLMHAGELGARHEYTLNDGRPLDVKLPAGRPVRPGESVRDWLKVIVSDVPFDASAFDLDPLEDAAASRRAWTTRSADRVSGTLERIAARAVSRDIGGAPPDTVARWAAATTTLETVVP